MPKTTSTTLDLSTMMGLSDTMDFTVQNDVLYLAIKLDGKRRVNSKGKANVIATSHGWVQVPGPAKINVNVIDPSVRGGGTE